MIRVTDNRAAYAAKREQLLGATLTRLQEKVVECKLAGTAANTQHKNLERLARISLTALHELAAERSKQ